MIQSKTIELAIPRHGKTTCLVASVLRSGSDYVCKKDTYYTTEVSFFLSLRRLEPILAKRLCGAPKAKTMISHVVSAFFCADIALMRCGRPQSLSHLANRFPSNAVTAGIGI